MPPAGMPVKRTCIAAMERGSKNALNLGIGDSAKQFADLVNRTESLKHGIRQLGTRSREQVCYNRSDSVGDLESCTCSIHNLYLFALVFQERDDLEKIVTDPLSRFLFLVQLTSIRRAPVVRSRTFQRQLHRHIKKYG